MTYLNKIIAENLPITEYVNSTKHTIPAEISKHCIHQ
jgi:hypothetical protein